MPPQKKHADPVLRNQADLAQSFLENYPLLLAMAMGKLRSIHDAEDAAQETYLRASKSLKRTVVVLKPRAWLIRILENVCNQKLNETARRRRDREELDRWATSVTAAGWMADFLIDWPLVLRAIESCLAKREGACSIFGSTKVYRMLRSGLSSESRQTTPDKSAIRP